MIFGTKILERPMGCQTSKLLKSFQLRSNPLRNRFIAFLCTSNWFFGPKRENSGLLHFSLGFRGKNFKNFRNFFSAQNYIKRYIRYWFFPHENVGPVYAPIRHTGDLKKILPKFRNTRKWKKWVIVPGGCTYLGWGAGQTKFHIIPPHPINISF